MRSLARRDAIHGSSRTRQPRAAAAPQVLHRGFVHERSPEVNSFVSGALGALTVLVAAAVARRAAWHRFAHHRGAAPRRILRRIGATPEQERAVLAETDALAEVLSGLRRDASALRADLAELLASPSLDAARVGAALDARLGKAGELRTRLAEAVARVHAALGPDQRARLATLVREGPHRRCGHHAHGAHAA
jgi:Spy/CpxP family protein refolding chaperone